MKKFLFSSAIFGLCISATSSYADCTGPIGTESEIIYDSSRKIPVYCNGTDWVAWGSGYTEKWSSTGSDVHYTAGNVGISTTSPDSDLDVAGNLTISSDDNSSTPIAIYNTDNVDSGPDIQFSSSSLIATEGSMNFNIDSDDSSTTASFRINANSNTSSAADNLLIVNETGNVGIGTSSPDDQLQIYDPTDQTSYSFHTGGHNVLFFNASSTGYHESSLYSGEIRMDPNNGFIALGVSPDTSTAVNSSHDILFIRENGNVGISKSVPTYKLYVNGTAYATGAAGSLSDRRHKKDIVSIADGAVDTIQKLRPVTYKWKEPTDEGMAGTQLGLIAQEVEEVVPEAVLTQDDEEKTKGLKYSSLIPILIKAVQEQQAEIEALKNQLNAK